MIRNSAVLQGHGQTGEYGSFHGGVLIVRVAHQDEMEPAVLRRSDWEAGATAPFATAGDGGGPVRLMSRPSDCSLALQWLLLVPLSNVVVAGVVDPGRG